MTTDASEATTGNVDSHAEASASEVSVPTRRSRISLACQSCRSRKTKSGSTGTQSQRIGA
ncbi:uncharacterized protein M421DRAFT_379948 [Didymella exigua CBS 183.55]|uniref:Uncharacterized protein n=1 Tax=Didymella exigua CBS 183.55 TaxID=1150837 RepID=A0A6A5R4D9_9PLEO|nr:uncharacterized protein M421DRAFT_379948 [Didymella exigua CBS 183.55]KAF1922259.1 hypothetical protein M421DRAFT_379948 [Didymella exigua CBS 183.55]